MNGCHILGHTVLGDNPNKSTTGLKKGVEGSCEIIFHKNIIMFDHTITFIASVKIFGLKEKSPCSDCSW